LYYPAVAVYFGVQLNLFTIQVKAKKLSQVNVIIINANGINSGLNNMFMVKGVNDVK